MSLTSVCHISELFDTISKHLNDQRPFAAVFGKTGSCEKINYMVTHNWISFRGMENNELNEIQLYLSSPPSKMILNPRLEGLKFQMHRFIESRIVEMVENKSVTEMIQFFFCFIFPFISFSFFHFQIIEKSKQASTIGSLFLTIALLLLFSYEFVYFTFFCSKRKIY
jgi:hypothetical protein